MANKDRNQTVTLHVTLVGGYNRTTKRSNKTEAQYKVSASAFYNMFPHADETAVNAALRASKADPNGYLQPDGIVHNKAGEKVRKALIVENGAYLLAVELVPTGCTVTGVKISKD